MSRRRLPPGELKENIQLLVKGKHIELLGGKDAIQILCREYLNKIVLEKESQLNEQK